MIVDRSEMTPEQAAYEIAEIWEPDWFGTLDQQRAKIFAENVPDEVESLLDVGCGNGLFLNYLSANRDKVHFRLCGVDRSRVALEHVRVEKYLSGIDCLPFKDKEFDIATSLEVIEHLPVTIYREALKEICRVARMYVLIGVPFNQDIRNGLIECPHCGCRFNADYHLRSFSELGLSNLLDAHGFYCKKIFLVSPVTIFRSSIYSIYVLIRALRRVYKNVDVDKYPGYAICPACFYENRENLKVQSTISLKRSKNMQRMLSVTLGKIIYRQSYRWIGALYRASD